ncbi:hypothetical protein [uncultured Mediterranean phage]|nr:hypothetical protein [uncultured Mediterranean phage]
MRDSDEEKLEKKMAVVRGERFTRALVNANPALAAAIEEFGEDAVLNNPDRAIYASLMNALLDPKSSHRDRISASKAMDEILGLSEGSALEKTTKAVQKLRDALTPKKIPAEVKKATGDDSQ